MVITGNTTSSYNGHKTYVSSSLTPTSLEQRQDLGDALAKAEALLEKQRYVCKRFSYMDRSVASWWENMVKPTIIG